MQNHTHNHSSNNYYQHELLICILLIMLNMIVLIFLGLSRTLLHHFFSNFNYSSSESSRPSLSLSLLLLKSCSFASSSFLLLPLFRNNFFLFFCEGSRHLTHKTIIFKVHFFFSHSFVFITSHNTDTNTSKDFC